MIRMDKIYQTPGLSTEIWGFHNIWLLFFLLFSFPFQLAEELKTHKMFFVVFLNPQNLSLLVTIYWAQSNGSYK